MNEMLAPKSLERLRREVEDWEANDVAEFLDKAA